MAARPGYKQGQRAAQLRALLQEHGPLTVAELAEKVQLAHGTVYRHLLRMEARRMAHVLVGDGQGVLHLWKATHSTPQLVSYRAIPL